MRIFFFRKRIRPVRKRMDLRPEENISFVSEYPIFTGEGAGGKGECAVFRGEGNPFGAEFYSGKVNRR